MNAVLIAVIVMVGLSLARVHVVLSLIIGALVGGLMAGLGVADSLNAFQEGIKNGAQIALSYAILGAFAMAIAHSGAPKLLADSLTARLNGAGTTGAVKWALFGIILVMAVFSQNLIPIHIAFIPLIVPPLLLLFNGLQVDRRLAACIITFGLVNTYMFIPYGFGDIFLNQIILKNVGDAGMDTTGVSIMQIMMIPALGMLLGLLTAIFISYRKPRVYKNIQVQTSQEHDNTASDKPSTYRAVVALIAIVIAFVAHLYTDSLLIGSMAGFAVFMASGVVKWREADGVFNDGIKMMAMIGFIMISAQGFAEVMKVTGQIDALVAGAMDIFGGNKGVAALVMLIIGLVVTLGIGSSFSTVPILAAIYVPLCMAMGFSMPATVALIATAGVLGDAGSPASDSTLGPTMGLNIDGQHDHIKDTVIPTFVHYNIPLIIFGWIAAMVL
ncbi:sodium:proton antiporter [Moraxella bovoculi]|uniref:Na+/H+ antiporter family protein n=1 Tax=Moraxella bovoculi TaxID=386891 RepID=UPI000624B5FC|nr:Na+/H+ antiporter NhaC family protein [Moraxella bovoculi]AKG16973.1 TRAP transporter large permease subunit [Moraxella bovoculi]AKG18718.1 sodium:proton antiporter [Moraxella bovoculi]